MGSEDIKTGSEVVTDFLESLQGDESIDADTLSVLWDLFESGRLSKTQILKSLEAVRAMAPEVPGSNAPDHD